MRVPPARPRYLEEGEAEQEEEHVDDLVDDETACEADHDEHAGAHVDPVLGIDASDQLPQAPEQRPSPRGLWGAKPGDQGVTSGPGRRAWPNCPAHSPVSATVTSISAEGVFSLLSSFSLTNRRSRSQKVRVYSNCDGEGRCH